MHVGSNTDEATIHPHTRANHYSKCLSLILLTRIIGFGCMHVSFSFTVLRRACLQAYTNIGLSLYSLLSGDNRVLEASTSKYLKLL